MSKEKRNTLEDVVLKSGRVQGNTIRQVDKAVQLLYDGYIVVVKDHWEYGASKKANQCLFDKIIERLHHEHP